MVHIPAQFPLRKYINAFLNYSAKTKRDGQTEGWGALQYLPSRAFGVAGDNNILMVSNSRVQ